MDTWTNLLDDIKVRGMVPTSQSTYTADRFLRLANAVMRSKIVPILDKVREGYYSYDYDYDIVDGSSYRIPARFVGAKLEDVALLNGTQRHEPPRFSEQELQDMTVSPDGNTGIYVKRNRIFVVPSDGGGWGTIRLTGMLRPNLMVDPEDAAQVTGFNTLTKVVTFDTVPDAWTTASILDIVEENPNFDWLAIDQAISAVTTGALGTITFVDALPTELAIGDWVSLAGETPVIQCPVELHPLLAQEVANVILRNGPDDAAYKLGEAEAKELREGAMISISPRVKEKAKNLVSRTGLLRRRM